MKICSYYRTRFKGAEDAACGYCIGTKDCESCSCGGNELKCNFYEHIRERARTEQIEAIKTASINLTEVEPAYIEVIGLNVNALIKALFERSCKEKQPFPWWVIEEIYEWKDNKYKGE